MTSPSRPSALLRWFLVLAAGMMIWYLTHVALQSLAYLANLQGAAWLRFANLALLPLSLLMAWVALRFWVGRET